MHILIVEDNPGDALLMRDFLREGDPPVWIDILTDGERALAFLRRKGEYTEVARPDLVILDLHLPKRDGREVLAELKADAALRDIPVVVVTGQGVRVDNQQLLTLGAERVMTKPMRLDEYNAMMREILEWWRTSE